jgi:YggT family protein
MQSALIFLFKALADFYLLTFLLRFILQWVRAGYYNPLSQFVLKVTSPLVVPARTHCRMKRSRNVSR